MARRTLAEELAEVLPRCIQQLSDSHHIEHPPRSDLEGVLQDYAYSFVIGTSSEASRFKQFFEPFVHTGRRGPSGNTSNLDSSDDDDDDDVQDETERSRHGFSLSKGQAKASGGSLGIEYSRARKGKPCGHIFKRGESVYRCKECGLDDSCVQCAKCFKASDHQGHEVAFSMHAGGCGCCDCGDHEAWNRPIRCAFHHPDVPYPDHLGGPSGQAIPQQLPIPAELLDLIRLRIGEAIDFVTAAVSVFPASTEPPRTIGAINVLRPGDHPALPRNPRANDYFGGPWSVVLWNDEKHSYEQVISQLTIATRCSRSHALAAATRVDSYGLELVATSSDVEALWKIANIIGRIELGVTVCTSRDAVLLRAVGIMLDWLQDMASARIGDDEAQMGRLVGEVLLSNNRLANLLKLEDRLWKRARAALRTTLMALLVVGQDCKSELAVQYTSAYPSLISSYLLTDREPDNSVTQFSVQLFSAPSVTTKVVAEHGFLVTLLQLLYSFFTQQHTTERNEKGLRLPPSIFHQAVDPESTSFKHKRYAILFADLHHTLSHPTVMQHLVQLRDNSFPALLAFLDLFTLMNTITRASAVHVEYETETWVTAFNLTIQLSRMAKSAGKAWHHSQVTVEPNKFVSAVASLLAVMGGSKRSVTEVVADPHNYHQVSFAGSTWSVIDFSVSKQPVSFHHPAHLFYSEMMKGLANWSSDSIASATGGAFTSYADFVTSRTALDKLIYPSAMEPILRVFALLAQIRAGVWVRNGFSVRAQHLHYREYTLRENTFDQDIYFLQTAFVSIDPSFVLVSLLDRFELVSVLEDTSRIPENSIYDRTQATAVLEEFLYLLIMLFSEPSDIESMSVEGVVRRELAHILLLGPYPYSEILKIVTERIKDEMCFDRVLSEVADFRPPDLSVVTSDVGGVYILKKDLYRELDPYYYRYNRNQREEASKLLKEHFGTIDARPQRKLRPQGAFGDNGAFTKILVTNVFIHILYKALEFATSTPEWAETVIDYVVHLVEIGLTEEVVDFEQQGFRTGLFVTLHRLQKDERVKEQKLRIKAIFKDFTSTESKEFFKAEEASMIVTPTQPSAANDADQKRLAAKARQAAIMQQFAAASKSFLEEHDDSEDEDDAESDIADESSVETTPLIQDEADIDAAAQDSVKAKRKRKLPPSVGSCIVCQEQLSPETPFGLLALIQTSSLIRLSTGDLPSVEEENQAPESLDADSSHLRSIRLQQEGPTIGSNIARKGLFASACGHMMHLSCFETYSQSISHRHSQQLTRQQPENTDRKEFTCPLCKSLGNVLLPLSEDDFEGSALPADTPEGLTDEWLHEAVESCSPVNPGLSNAIPMLLRNGSGQMRAWRISESLPTSPSTFGFSTISQAERKMLERLVGVVAPLDVECRMLDTAPEEHGSRTISHELIAYTVSAIEVALRGKATGTLNSQTIPDATAKLLRSLLSVLGRMVILNTGTPRGNEFVRQAFLYTMFGTQHPLQAEQYFLQRDPLTMLTEVAAVAPEEFYQFASLLFYAHILRVLHRLFHDTQSTFPLKEPVNEDSVALQDFCVSVQEARWTRGRFTVTEEDKSRAFIAVRRVYPHALPFLRRAAILRNVLFPDSPVSQASEGESEFSRLLSLLRIPHPRELVGRRHGKSAHKMTSLSSILNAWDTRCLEPSHDMLQPIVHDTIELEQPIIYELFRLPEHLDELIESMVTRKCNRCRTMPTDPAICLICGELVCQQSYCCMDAEPGEEAMHGECNTHMWECGTSSGIYFLVKKCVLIYLYADKGTFVSAPYLDSHGETDTGLRKHRPLYLNQARYDEVRKLWLNHSIATVVARKLDSGNDSGGWSTF